MMLKGFIKMNIKYCIFFLFVFISVKSFSNTLYVSTTGSDDHGTGDINMPYQSLFKATTVAVAGTTIYIRGGNYGISSTIYLKKNGTAKKYITISSYQNETVVLDFSSEPYTSAMRGIEIDKGYGYWYIKNLIIYNAGDNGIYISGNNNIIENCQVSCCRDAGIQISSGGCYNYLHNCDCFANYDYLTDGGNADGFSVKLAPGPGNVLRGCRSWNNSDDGYDLYENAYTVIFDSCWSWHNGYAYSNGNFITTSTMNGNGFKVGGNYVIGHHRLTNCISFGNKSKGFDQNNNDGGVTVINCTGYNNGYYNFSFPNDTVKDNQGNVLYIKEGIDSMINNISYLSPGARFAKYHNVQTTNSWNIRTVTANDFISIDTSLARTARLSDGTLPTTSFLRLNTGSTFIDAGTPYGVAYVGAAPDLGAFETTTENTSIQSIVLNGTVNNKQVFLNWTVVNEIANSGWVVQKASQINATSFSDFQDLLNVSSQGAGGNAIHFYDSVDNLNHYGSYVYRLKQTDNANIVHYSNIVEISSNNTTLPSVTTISVYPCPFQSVFYINFSLPSPKVVQAELFNNKGQMISTIVNHYYNSKGNYYVPYNGSNLATGIYYLKFLADDGTKQIIPLLKSN